MRGARHDALDLARVAAVVHDRARPVERDVSRRLGKELRRVRFERGARVGDRGALLVIDRDQLSRILRGGERLGDHERDRLTDMQHAVTRQRRAERHDELASIAACERRMHRARADPGRIQLLVGQNRDDAGDAARSLDVERADVRAGVRRAHETRIGLVFLRRVLDETAEPADQRVVLDARLEVMLVMRRLIHAAGLPDRASHTARPAE